MSELQSEDLSSDTFDFNDDVEVTESVEAEVVEAEESAEAEEETPEPADLATDSEVEHEKTNEYQGGVQQAINKKHRELMDERRAREAVEARLAELESKQQAIEPPVPELPEFASQDEINEYQAQFKARIEWEKDRAYTQQEQGRAAQALQQAKQIENQKKAILYTERATKQGISQQELQSAGNIVASYQLSDGLVNEILDDSEGALITTYLAANPLEIETIKSMTDIKAARYLDTAIKPKLRKPKATNATRPATRVDGKTTDPDKGKYKHLDGAKFE